MAGGPRVVGRVGEHRRSARRQQLRDALLVQRVAHGQVVRGSDDAAQDVGTLVEQAVDDAGCERRVELVVADLEDDLMVGHEPLLVGVVDVRLEALGHRKERRSSRTTRQWHRRSDEYLAFDRFVRAIRVDAVLSGHGPRLPGCLALGTLSRGGGGLAGVLRGGGLRPGNRSSRHSQPPVTREGVR